MSASKTTAALLASVLTMSLILLSPVSARADTGPTITGFSLGQFGASSVVVDDAQSMVLVAGSAANAVDVFGFSGDLLQAIPQEAGASGLAIVGSTAYVSDKTSGVIDRVDLDTLSSDGPLATGLTDPASIAFTGGRLWVSTATGLAAVDPSSGTVSMFPSPTRDQPFLSSSPGAPGELFAADTDQIPGSVVRVDVSSGTPVVAAYTTGVSLGLISDIAVTADGTRLLVTGSQVTEFLTSTMAWDGVEYTPAQFSYALATSPGLGGIMAEGLSVNRGSPDLVVNPLGQDSPLLSTELDDSGVDWIAPHTLALSSDGSHLFAVNPVPYFGTSQTFYAIHFTPAGGTTAPVGSVGLLGVGTLAGLGLFLTQLRRRRRRAA